ncbi:MAG: helix-turn-helix domain-containing protein [Candidatus Magasanikiibacteriota bacterium]
MTNINNVLQNLGLDDKEAKIYLALLELGSGTVQEVAKKSGVKRTNIYNFIGPLKTKNIISEVIEDDKIILVPENPDVLVKRAEKNYQEIKTALPELMGIFNTPGNKPKVRYYEGTEGLRKGWDDLLETQTAGAKVYAFSDYEKMFNQFPEDWLWYVPETRVKKNIFFYCVAKDGSQGKKVKAKDKKQLRETKLFKDLQLDTEINIYDNKVLLMSFRRPYTAIIIEDRAIAMSMKSIWDGWWNKNTK